MDLRKICGSFYQFSFVCIFILILFQFESVTHWTAMWTGKTEIKGSWTVVPSQNVENDSENVNLDKLVQEVRNITDQLKNLNAVSENFKDYDVETVPDESVQSEEMHYKNVAVVDLDTEQAEESEDTQYEDIQIVNSDNPVNKSTTLIVLFSSWSYSAEKLKVHQALLRLWSSWLLSSVHPLMITDDTKARKMALASNWSVLPVTKKINACKGPPVLPNMFLDTMNVFEALFYGYANADIIFGDGLVQTLKFLRNIYRWSESPLLIVGRRYNFDFTHYSVQLNNSQQVKSLLKRGQLVIRSTDYFFTNKAFPWKQIPWVTIGRPFIVRAVIGYAIKHHFDIIDATKTIESVHLTTEDGIYASWNKPGKNCNRHLLIKQRQKLPLGVGHCECAKLETARDNKGFIRLRSRKPSRKLCPGLR